MDETNETPETIRIECIDRTVFEVPRDVPEWDAVRQTVTIDGVAIDDIVRDPSKMPAEIAAKYCTHRGLSFETPEEREKRLAERADLTLEVFANARENVQNDI